ncbi:MAG: hypothetical protein GQ574_10370 [Crocinitomix sp.]|nr:hypothetical protein [Crocinitomix sp.]
MTPEEIIVHYFDKKSKNELTKSEIKAELATKHGFTPEKIKAVMIEISNRELFEIQNQKSALEKFLSSIAVSYFFLVFGLIVIVVSIFILQTEVTTRLNKILPLILVCGAIFMIYKHGKMIYHYRNQK